jgi:hypothetical protein
MLFSKRYRQRLRRSELLDQDDDLQLPDPQVDPEFSRLRIGMLKDMAHALASAASELRRITSEPGASYEGPQMRGLISLVKLIPSFLPELEQAERQQVAVCPECLHCGAAPGSHWAHECPHIHPKYRDRYIFDYRRKCAFLLKQMEHPIPGLHGLCPFPENSEQYRQWAKRWSHQAVSPQVYQELEEAQQEDAAAPDRSDASPGP